jgi:hypothetical protein
VWACLPCDAWVGCHRNSKRHAPLGRLANRELRIAKMEAHAAFDPLWRAKVDRDGCSKQAARGAAYRWLAEQLQIDRAACHIGMFDEELCWAVVDVCRPVGRRVAA